MGHHSVLNTGMLMCTPQEGVQQAANQASEKLKSGMHSAQDTAQQVGGDACLHMW